MPGVSSAGLRAEVGQPPVVREQPRRAQLSRVRVTAAPGHERAAVREHDLGDDAVVLELLDASLRIPLTRGAARDVFGLFVSVVLVERRRARTAGRLLPTPSRRPSANSARWFHDSAYASRYFASRYCVKSSRSPDRVTVGRDHHKALHRVPLSLQLQRRAVRASQLSCRHGDRRDHPRSHHAAAVPDRDHARRRDLERLMGWLLVDDAETRAEAPPATE